MNQYNTLIINNLCPSAIKIAATKRSHHIMSKTLGLASLFLLFSFTADPIKLNMKEVLATAQKDERFVLNNQTLALAKGLNYHLPLLQKLDFRLGTDDYGLGQNQYGIGLSFNTFKQIKRLKDYQQVQTGVIEAQNNLYLQQSLMDRYECLYDMFFNKQLIKQYNELDTLLNKKNTVLKEQILRGMDVRIKDVVDNETDRYATQKILKTYEREWQERYQKLLLLTKQKELDIDFKRFIDYKIIESVVVALPSFVDANSPEMQIRLNQVALSKAELGIEKADNFRIFNGLQLGLEKKPKDDLLQNPFFRLNLSVPLMGNMRFKQNELLLQIKDYENRSQLLKTSLQQNAKTQTISLKKLIDEHKSMISQQEKSLIQTLLANKKITAEMTASDLLDLKIIQRKGQIDITKSAFSLTQDYISLLNQTGVLVNPPMKNYLSQDLEHL